MESQPPETRRTLPSTSKTLSSSSSGERRISTMASSLATESVVSGERAPSTASARSWVGIEAWAKYSQIRMSSLPGISSTSALSTARPARPICW